MESYRPKVRLCAGMPQEIAEQAQGRSDAFYAGVETEIVREPAGYILKAYVNGKHVGGLQDLPSAMVNG